MNHLGFSTAWVTLSRAGNPAGSEVAQHLPSRCFVYNAVKHYSLRDSPGAFLRQVVPKTAPPCHFHSWPPRGHLIVPTAYLAEGCLVITGLIDSSFYHPHHSYVKSYKMLIKAQIGYVK